MDILTSWLYPTNSKSLFTESKELRFYVGEVEHTVTPTDISLDTTLNTYLRQIAFLTGTKNMCLEGGCGACIVAATILDPVTSREIVYAVNSCLIPVYLCSSWHINTIESIGNPPNGYHPVQNVLVKFNGTQCGFCSSGMIMSMYALHQSGDFTMKDVENSFGGNLCRCTGYRPILSAFKSLATDASSEKLGEISDIEDFPVCQRRCTIKHAVTLQPHFYQSLGSRWYKVFSINEIFDVLTQYPDQPYLLISGDTAKGVFKRMSVPDIYIDITSVKKLLQHEVLDDCVVLGANVTLTNTIKLFNSLAKDYPKFTYLKKLAEHIQLIANVPVRNVGTLAGNLFTKYEHPEFPSDIFLIFETIGATLTLLNQNKEEKTMSLTTFLDFKMKNTIIMSIRLPALDKTYQLETYKIMPRAENTHALINAGFLLKFASTKVEIARMVYGGIRSTFSHANAAEKFVADKDLFNNNTLQGLFKTLSDEIQPDDIPPNPTPKFRKELAIALFYKYILSIAPDDKISPRNKSGGLKHIRPVSSGTQDYETNESLYPLTQPISKIEAMAQCSGKAKYIMDMPDWPNQLYAAFVLAKARPNSIINKVDVSSAMALDGVVAFYSKDDIPGKNTFTPLEEGQDNVVEEEIFCSGVVKFYHQPIGIIIATSHKIAEKAADLVNVSYTEAKEKPLLTIKDIIDANATTKMQLESKHDAISKGNDVKHIIKGTFYNGWQYHFSMETQCCNAVPVDDGLDLFPSTQNMNAAQVSAAKMLNIPVSSVNVSVRRLGGAYGGKLTRNSLVSCAAALAAYKLQKPVKLWMPLSTNMNVIGKRFPCYCTYEVGFNDNGVIQYLNADIYSDMGHSGDNEKTTSIIQFSMVDLYNTDTWDFKIYKTKSDCHTGTYCRAPGRTETTAILETIMEHIARTLDSDPIQVRYKNLMDAEMQKHLGDLVQWAEIEKRRKDIEEFNKANRWIKRGIAAVPMRYKIILYGNWSVYLSIFQGDGSVSVAHAGIEMGQGINTKAAQVCAYSLGIPLHEVSIKSSNVTVTPNAASTSGSITSEAVCFAIVKICEMLKQRMQPVKEKMNNPTWKQLVQQCYIENVRLTETFMYHNEIPEIKSYSVYGATCVETEVDILTGVYQIKRVDIIEDTGTSISPQIDIGQVEGGFIMGMGYWTMENIIYGPDGQLLTNNTWTFKIPGAKDIPVDLRVKFPKNNPNPVGVLYSKATGEPPVVMSCAVPFAIRNAVAYARAEADPAAVKWYPIDGPSTVENTFLNSLHDYKQYTL